MYSEEEKTWKFYLMLILMNINERSFNHLNLSVGVRDGN